MTLGKHLAKVLAPIGLASVVAGTFKGYYASKGIEIGNEFVEAALAYGPSAVNGLYLAYAGLKLSGAAHNSGKAVAAGGGAAAGGMLGALEMALGYCIGYTIGAVKG